MARLADVGERSGYNDTWSGIGAMLAQSMDTVCLQSFGVRGIVTNAARILQRKSNTLFSICQTLMREKEQSVCFPGINFHGAGLYQKVVYC